MQLTTFVHFPMMVGLIIIAKPMIDLLFYRKMGEYGVIFSVNVPCRYALSLQLVNLDILKLKAAQTCFFQLTLIKRVLIILTIIITYRWD